MASMAKLLLEEERRRDCSFFEHTDHTTLKLQTAFLNLVLVLIVPQRFLEPNYSETKNTPWFKKTIIWFSLHLFNSECQLLQLPNYLSCEIDSAMLWFWQKLSLSCIKMNVFGSPWSTIVKTGSSENCCSDSIITIYPKKWNPYFRFGTWKLSESCVQKYHTLSRLWKDTRSWLKIPTVLSEEKIQESTWFNLLCDKDSKFFLE